MIYAIIWTAPGASPALPPSELHYECSTLSECLEYAAAFADATPHTGRVIVGDARSGRVLAEV